MCHRGEWAMRTGLKLASAEPHKFFRVTEIFPLKRPISFLVPNGTIS